MADRYLLVCKACGNGTPVARRQAGELLTCACGATLEVPTLLQLQKLEKVAESPEQAAAARGPAWSVRHGVAVAGGVAILLGFAWIAILLLMWPKAPDEGFREEWTKINIERMSPARSLGYYDYLRKTGLQGISPAEFEAYEDRLLRSRIALGFAGFFTVVGLIALGGAYLAGRRASIGLRT